MTEEGKIARHPARPGVLSLTIRERSALYTAYMPFIKGGGLFIPTTRTYQMGDQVYMLLSLMDEPTKLSLSGKVVWITPPGAQGNRQQGIGVQFEDSDSGRAARNKIEGILGNALKSSKPTHTL
ncbi:MAG: PilZ domain-containing protein [Thiobacillaceae bacterium]|nr:PilZ domain-containing protein [Thiobacillaceae bacterium]MDW8324225.1 PilZ domain-containing protein [Burkholderiales bacterium]